MPADNSPSAATEQIAAAASDRSAALKRASDAAEQLRQRSDLAAKVLASAGTTVVAAVGLSKFSDVWPWPGGWSSGAALGAVLAGFVAMVFAVFAVAYRYWKLSQPTPFNTDLEGMAGDLSEGELALITPIYEEFAELNQVASSAAYEARAFRFERIARWLNDDEAARVRAEANLIGADILSMLARAKLRVLRSRSTTAVRGRGAVALYVLFAAGVLAFGLGADWLQSERTDRIDLAKKCADARAVTKIVESELPDICGELASSEETPKAAAAQIAAVNASLATAYGDCLAATTTPNECDPIKNARDTLLPP